jgi:hypothetical protein
LTDRPVTITVGDLSTSAGGIPPELTTGHRRDDLRSAALGMAAHDPTLQLWGGCDK